MATSTTTTVSSNSSAANYRLWGKAIDDQFPAMGWVRTADTGQVNWVTVAVPTIGAFPGYSIFRMADTLQATKPCFIKVEYGASSASATFPAFRFSIGSGSDGAGNLTGVVITTPQTIECQTSHTAATAVSYYSGDTGRFCMNPFYSPNTQNNAFFFSIERTVDSSGAADGTGLVICWGFYTASLSTQVLIWGQGATTVEGQGTAPLPTAVSNYTFGTDVGVGNINFFAGKLMFGTLNQLAYVAADFAAGLSFTVQAYGGGHTYRTMGSRAPYVNATSVNQLMMRYE